MNKNKLGNKEKLSFQILTLPAVVLFLVFFIYPVLNGIYYSFTDWNGIGQNYNFIGLQNYINIFSDNRALSSFEFTIKFSVLVVIFVIVISVLLALLLNSKLPNKLKVFFRSVYFFPAVLSLIVVGLIWNEVFYRALPMIGSTLGIEALSSNPLGSPSTAIYAIVFVAVWQGVAIPLVILLAGLQSIPDDIYEASKIDGAGPVATFFKITLPYLIPSLNVVFVLTLRNSLTVFDYIMSLTGGGPARSTESIGLLIYNQGFYDMKYGYALAQSVLLLILISFISILQLKFSSRKEVDQV
ncbi:carbohydrate ABC transporter permease [Amphibacillus sp. Q70]|uniref:carbohydrate ABC transporter permease n=1 Tax=Amphibacillus sp. Q70 TaxID=3453416 RepID=UPI003F85E906